MLKHKLRTIEREIRTDSGVDLSLVKEIIEEPTTKSLYQSMALPTISAASVASATSMRIEQDEESENMVSGFDEVERLVRPINIESAIDI
jgi:hypothetical protein